MIFTTIRVLYDDLYSSFPAFLLMFASQINKPIIKSSGTKYAANTGGKRLLGSRVPPKLKTIFAKTVVIRRKAIHDKTRPTIKCKIGNLNCSGAFSLISGVICELSGIIKYKTNSSYTLIPNFRASRFFALSD